MSQYQLTGVNPVETIVTSRSGDRTTGYPEISMNFSNVYTFSKGKLRGFKVGGTVLTSWRLGDYYYYPTGYTEIAERELFSRPVSARFNAIIGYTKRFKKVTWSTQVNIDNMFNNYEVLIRPNNIAGYAGVNGAIFTAQPRSYIWTNTFKF